MSAKFLIVNNGLKNLRGHYFETAMSVAEAARDAGFIPLLAAHYTCPPGLTPPWLAFLPLCRVEHWIGYPPTPINGWSKERQDAFVEYVGGRGATCAVFEDRPRGPHQWAALQRSVSDWLLGLPKPVGVMAANDSRGRQVLEACREYGLRVPDDVAVIGVDNDELLCGLSTPPLSSRKRRSFRSAFFSEKSLRPCR